MGDPTPNGSGCFSQLLMLITALLIPFFAAFQSSSTTLLEPPVEATAASVALLEVVYSPVSAEFTPDQLEEAAKIMEQRLVALEVPQAMVEITSEREITVSLPQTDDAPAIYNALGNRGLVEFVDFSGVDLDGPAEGFTWERAYIATSAGIQRPFEEATLNPVTNEPFETVISGTDVIRAVAEVSQFGGWQVYINFSEAGAETLTAFTRAHIGQPMAIVVDSVVVSVPVIQAELGSEAVIQANYTEQDARQLAIQIGIGALPIDLQIDSVFYPG